MVTIFTIKLLELILGTQSAEQRNLINIHTFNMPSKVNKTNSINSLHHRDRPI